MREANEAYAVFNELGIHRVADMVEELGSVKAAAESVGIRREYLFRWLKRDPARWAVVNRARKAVARAKGLPYYSAVLPSGARWEPQPLLHPGAEGEPVPERRPEPRPELAHLAAVRALGQHRAAELRAGQ